MGLQNNNVAASRSTAVSFCQNALHFAWLEITQHCNLRCLHCYTSSSPARKHNDIDWKSVIQDVYDVGCRQIQFIGGEPLTHPKFREYAEFASQLGFGFIEVYTNAALLDKPTSAFLADHQIDVATSFYSTDATIHDAVTLTKGSFEQTITGIRNALSSNLALRVGVISVADDCETIEQKFDFLETLGVERKMIRADGVRPVGRGTKITPFVSQFETLCGSCWKGKLVISYDGNCYPCVLSRDVVVGNIKEDSVAEIITGRALNGFRISYGSEVMEKRAQCAEHGESTSLTAFGEDCGPNCEPSGPCSPNCSPKCPPPCNPDVCGPVNPSCGPNDAGCLPYNIPD